MVQDRAILTMADQCLSNGAIFNDREQPLTQFSISRHSLTPNISQTALDRAIVATKCE